LALFSAAPAFADSGDLTAYVRARAADAAGDSEQAAAGYSAALTASPGNPLVAARAYREAFSIGDLPLARRAAAVLKASGVAPGDIALLDFADAVRGKDKRTTQAAIDRIGDGPFDFLAPVLRAWVAYSNGDKEAATALGALTGNPLAIRYARENRALLLIAAGRIDEGLESIHILFGAGQGSLDLRVTAAELLYRHGKKLEAAGLLAGEDPAFVEMRAHPPKSGRTDAAFGASRLFTRLSADLASGEPNPLSLVLPRLAILLEPGNARAHLLLADVQIKQDETARALTTLAEIPADSPFAAAARVSRIGAFDGEGDDAAALAAAKLLATNGDRRDAERYADLLMKADRYGEAATVYAEAIARSGPDVSWSLYLQRGGALDRAGNWAEAEPLLVKAVALAPDQPVALNYLAYARVERGENLAEAQAMLEKAAKLSPGEPSIADSLAWAYFARGNLAKALPLLEGAAQKLPSNATINEHLGDTYWALGRRYEARYAWRAAAVFADETEGKRIATKLTDGPPPRVGGK